jgi:hypothetical protein
LLADYAAGTLPSASADEVRAHLVSGCRDCLERLFNYPVGLGTAAVPAPPAPTGVSPRYTPLVLGLAAGVAALAAWPILDVERGRERQQQHVQVLTERYDQLERTRGELAERLEVLDREIEVAERKAVRQARLVRTTAKKSEDVERQLDSAQKRLGSLLGHAAPPVVTTGSGGAAPAPPAVVAHVPSDPPRALAGGGGEVAAQPPPSASPCVGLSAVPFELCTTFCERLDCDVQPREECEALRRRLARRIGSSVFPCESVTLTEDVTPCDRQHLDVWTFRARAGQRYTAAVDTADRESAADLCLLGACDSGETFSADDQVACSFPLAGFGCPRATFVAPADGLCTVAVTVCSACTTPAATRYRLTIEGVQGVSLVGDDVS